MKVGDLVEIKSMNRLGIIVKEREPLEIGLEVFDVLIQDGVVRRKTSAAMHKVRLS